MIREPPEAPAIMITSPLLSVTTVGLIDDKGRFPGFMKFALAGR